MATTFTAPQTFDPLAKNQGWDALGINATDALKRLQAKVDPNSVLGKNIASRLAPTMPTATVGDIPSPATPPAAPAAPEVGRADTLIPDTRPPQTVEGGVLFRNTPGTIGADYQRVLGDQLSGKAMDPFAAGAREADARMAANNRAATANRIATSGFTGQGMGEQIASAAEDKVRQNRFDTEIGIQKTTNEMQSEALGEARQYGTLEQGYAQDALTEAAESGSDADFIAAYKQAYGRDLDPMAVSTYRGYVRRSNEQKLASGEQAIEKGRQDITSAAKDEAGKGFAAYTQGHLDLTNMAPEQAMQDPGFKNAAQQLWESYGQTGPVPAAWAMQQAKAANDPRLTNSIVASNYEIDQAVASGAMSAEDGQLIKDFNSQGLTQFLTRDPATGKVVMDWNKINTMNPSSATPAAPTVAVTDIPKGKEGAGSIFSKDGSFYKVDNKGQPQPLSFDPTSDDVWGDDAGQIMSQAKKGDPLYDKIVAARIEDVVDNGNYRALAGLPTSDPVYQAALKKTDALNISYSDNNFKNDQLKGNVPAVGTWVKVKVKALEMKNGVYTGKTIEEERLLRVTDKGTRNKPFSTSDYAFIEFEDADGKQYRNDWNNFSANIVEAVGGVNNEAAFNNKK